MKHLAYNYVNWILRSFAITIAVLMAFVIIGCSEDEKLEEVATFIQANPTNGSTIQEDEDIIVTFDMPPAGLSVTGGQFSLSSTSVTITGPFTPGTVNIILNWTGGAQALTYTVEPVLITGLGGFASGIALDVQGGKIYWTNQRWGDGSKIQRANLDGSNIEDLITGLEERPTSIALDIAKGKMYWTEPAWRGEETGKIRRANLDGSNIEDLVKSKNTEDLPPGVLGPSGIALDVPGGKMYCTTDYRVMRSNLDGSNAQYLRKLPGGEGIALDIAGRKIYLTTDSSPRIQRSNLDGSSIEDLITGLEDPRGIALDVAGGRMYWTDRDTNKIQRSNLDGSNVQELLTGLDTPTGIALDVASGKMYWTESDKIRRANLDGSF